MFSYKLKILKHRTLWLFILFVLASPLITPYLRGDGIGYYSYVASLITDGDLWFEDEYRHADPWHYHNYFDEQGHLKAHLYTKTGHIHNKFSTGPSILWIPFFGVAHIIAKYTHLFPADGFLLPYRYLCAFGTALYGFIGLFLAFKVARDITGEWEAFWATIGIWFASALPVYMYFLPFMSHAHSVFICSLFVWFWWRTYRHLTDRRIWEWGVLGFLLGFAFSTYYVNLLLGLFVAIDLVEVLRRSPKPFPQLLGATGAFLGGLFLGWLPTGVVKWIIFGSPFRFGYTERWFFFNPRLWQVLFASEHGLWAWTPLILLACIGFIPLIRRCPPIGWRCVGTFLIFWYVIASFQNWHGQSSFSNRFFLSLTPLFVLGFSALLKEIREKTTSRPKLRTLVPICILLLSLWNWGFIFQWGTNMIPNRGPISWSVMIRNQFTEVPIRVLQIARGFITDRMSIMKEIEKQDVEEIKKYRVRR